MVPNKSLDSCLTIIAALLRDVSQTHPEAFNTHAADQTFCKVRKRCASEGIFFLTKTLPRLGKAFDKALSGCHPLNSTELRFERSEAGSQLPRFLGELIGKVLLPNGVLKPELDVSSNCATATESSESAYAASVVRSIRNVLFVFYKLNIPYDESQEQQVLEKFERTDRELIETDRQLQTISSNVDRSIAERTPRRCHPKGSQFVSVVTREARILLSNLLASFDPYDIRPRHGPGVVSTRERLWDKYLWRNVDKKITNVYPLDAYFYASPGHVCDSLHSLVAMSDKSHPARVLLVPKDSRGPRLISCEPVDKQWIQQGLGRALVKLVEQHPLTKENVRFTDQSANRNVALMSSRDGRYATLDLNEASDRVSSVLVRLLFPEWFIPFLEACRSDETRLPCGRIVKLNKFAPMGSALCFPVLALVVWSILSAGAPDEYTRNRILVYGDDVIVPGDYAETSIELLESFGLKINRDKSCTKGSLRESCGMDAFKGVCVTPLRIREVWSSLPSAGSYTTWIAYANQYWDMKYYHCYNVIVDWLEAQYGPIPSKDLNISCPSLSGVRGRVSGFKTRWNPALHRVEHRVLDIHTPVVHKHLPGWVMLLRYFVEGTPDTTGQNTEHTGTGLGTIESRPFSSSSYTQRGTSMLVKRWR